MLSGVFNNRDLILGYGWKVRATVTGCLIWGGFLGHLWSTTCEVFYTWHWAFYLAICGFWGEQSLCRLSQLNFLYEIILRCMNVSISHICSVILHPMPSSVLQSDITFHIVICQWMSILSHWWRKPTLEIYQDY